MIAETESNQPDAFDLRGKTVWVAGHTGMAGSAIARRLAAEDCELLTCPHASLDLTRQDATESFLARARPAVVVNAAGLVGGILHNAGFPADFLYKNLMIAANVVEAARRTGVEKLLYLGSSCIYPRETPQPMREEDLLTGRLESTNEGYAVAKIAGVKLTEMYSRQHGCCFISVLPTNLYGPNDHYDLGASHVLPALMRKIHEARLAGRRKVEIWGSGRPLREFLHVDDLADACVHLLRRYSAATAVNVGSGEEVSIRTLAEMIADVVGYDGEFDFDSSKPDGTARKRLDMRVLDHLGWKPTIGLRRGLESTYRQCLERPEFANILVREAS